MSKYFISYSGKEKEGVNIFYNIEYFTADFEKGKLDHAFTLRPTIQLNPRMGNVSEPATKHFLDKDIYTHITYADLENLENKNEKVEFLDPVQHVISVGDTISTSNSLIYFQGIAPETNKSELGLGEKDIAVGAILNIIDINKKTYEARPLFIIRDNTVFSKEVFVEELGLKIAFEKINPEDGKVTFAVAEKKDNKREFIIMKAVIFPQINILWTGCILLVLGSSMAIRKRFGDLRRQRMG